MMDFFCYSMLKASVIIRVVSFEMASVGPGPLAGAVSLIAVGVITLLTPTANFKTGDSLKNGKYRSQPTPASTSASKGFNKTARSLFRPQSIHNPPPASTYGR